jgi:WD40 repeat protein
MSNAASGEIQQLFDTENDNDIVTSVSWIKGGSTPVLAIGTSSKQIQLWDTVKFERIRMFDSQHEGRVSSLAWNPLHTSLLSSGSLDSKIYNNDIRLPDGQSLVCGFRAHR